MNTYMYMYIHTHKHTLHRFLFVICIHIKQADSVVPHYLTAIYILIITLHKY